MSTTLTLSLRAKTTACEPTLIKLSNLSAPFKIRRLEIGNTNCGDWIVSDLRVNEWSQFVIGGDVPGDMFASNTGHNENIFESCDMCQAGGSIEVAVCYIGPQPDDTLILRLIDTTPNVTAILHAPCATLEVNGQTSQITSTYEVRNLLC